MKNIKFKKIISAFLISAVIGSAFVGCNTSNSGEQSINPDSSRQSNTEKAKINVGTLKGPTAIGMLNLMEQDKNNETKNDYEFKMFGSPDEIVASFNKGELDVIAVPTNLASVLYNKTQGNVNILAVNTLGVLYLLENGNSIKQISDLKGKTVYATGKGATPQYVLEYLLKKNNLEIGKDVKVEYKSEHSELAALISSNQAEIALLPQPFVTTVTTKNDKIKIALDINKEWETSQNGNKLAMGAIIAKKDFTQKNAEAIKTFMDEYKKSAEKATTDIEKTAVLCGQYEVMPTEVAKKAIINCGITFIQGNDMQKMVSDYLNVLVSSEPKSVGGKVPSEDFYYKG